MLMKKIEKPFIRKKIKLLFIDKFVLMKVSLRKCCFY